MWRSLFSSEVLQRSMFSMVLFNIFTNELEEVSSKLMKFSYDTNQGGVVNASDDERGIIQREQSTGPIFLLTSIDFITGPLRD